MMFYQFVILFLIINFGGLYIGNLVMNNGPMSEWCFKLSSLASFNIVVMSLLFGIP